MKHRVYHSTALRSQLDQYAQQLVVDSAELAKSYEWMLANEVVFEEGDVANPRVSICSVNIETRIDQPLARRFYVHWPDPPLRSS
jgi:hypothetical protein